MSSAGISYRVVSEPVLREQAEQRLRLLSARVGRMSQRCVAAGLPALASADPRSLSNSAAISAECARLESLLGDTEPAVQAAQIRRRAQQIDRDLAATLADLSRRENSAAHSRSQRAETTMDAVVADRRQRLAARVERLLATLLEPSSELQQAGIAVCGSADPARGELLLSGLDSRIAAANAATRQLREGRELLAELRDAATELGDNGGAAAMLDRAEQTLDRAGDAGEDLRRARELIESRSVLENNARQRRFVLTAVEEALAEMGYAATPVAMDTAGSIVLAAPGSTILGVRARIVDGEIDIRTVRTTAAAAQDTTAAESAICADLRGLPDGLRARGVLPERVRYSAAGLVTVQTLATEHLAADGTAPGARVARKAVREGRSEA
ncbi:hypothetical protein ACFXHA_32765 [Nocardia sp. NPDC059240]|uniref:hypothetical protein n=1 Tax=Nocardia sp. NPDC059240 TaxID=3346786 RepID=UPI0036A9CD80